MFKNLAIALVLATTSVLVVDAQDDSNSATTSASSSSSRVIKPWDDIASAIEADAADSKATFTISASHLNFGQDSILSPEDEASIEENAFSFDVNVAIPAVTADTLISDEDGNVVRMGDLSYSLLVPSQSEFDDGTVALISVDHNTGEVNGFVQKKDSTKGMLINQEKGRSITAVEGSEFEPPAWECSVTEEHENEPVRHRLLEGDHHDDHSYEGHDHHHDHDVHIHNHDHGLDAQDLVGSLENLRKSLRGADDSFGDRRRLQTSSLYDVQVHVLYDQALINKNGGSEANTINYITLLFTAANLIYSSE